MKELLTIDDVCAMAKISKPTVYRRVKAGTFPKPIKVPSNAARGPKNVNRWERKAILNYMLKGNELEPLSDEAIAAAAMAKDFEAIHADHEPEEKKPNYTLMAIIGGMAAALAVWMFQ